MQLSYRLSYRLSYSCLIGCLMAVKGQFRNHVHVEDAVWLYQTCYTERHDSTTLLIFLEM